MSMSDIPKEFTQEYYDEKYFAVPKGKKFKRSNGSIDAWSYANATGEFLGAKEIAKAWKEVFNPKTMLDVGCGRGTFVAYARDFGINAYGFDYSKWAIENRYSRCKREWLKIHDATKSWPYKDRSFGLLTALDFFEHIYLENLDFVINEMYRVAKKWIFLQIAVAGSGGLQGTNWKGYTLKRDEPVPVDLEGCAVAGHVLVKPESFWYEKFEHDDWLARRDMVNWFCSLVDEAIIRNWLLNSIIVLERLQ